MAKSTKKTQQKKDKPQKKDTSPSYNRLRTEKNPSTDPAYLERQRRYYARQSENLANKKQYRKDVKEGKRVPVKKGEAKGRRKIAELSEHEAEAKRAKARNKYKKNKDSILASQAKYKREKAEKAKQQAAQNAIDNFKKLNGY